MTDTELENLTAKLLRCGPVAPPPELNRTNMGLGRVLRDLHEAAGPVSARDLAEHAGVSTARMTVLLKKLDSRGLIRIGKDDLDRRKVLVSLSPEGLRLCGEIRENTRNRVRALAEHFGYERFSAFLDMAAEVHDYLARSFPLSPECGDRGEDGAEGGEDA